jgi:hypothetical protein
VHFKQRFAVERQTVVWRGRFKVSCHYFVP